jgi:hypothetical protein
MKPVFNRLSDIALGAAAVAAVPGLVLAHQWEKTHHIATICETAASHPQDSSAAEACADDTARRADAMRRDQNGAAAVLVAGSAAMMSP